MYVIHSEMIKPSSRRSKGTPYNVTKSTRVRETIPLYKQLHIVVRLQANRISARSHPQLQSTIVLPLLHVVKATGPELSSAAYISAFSATLVAGQSLADGPERAHCNAHNVSRLQLSSSSLSFLHATRASPKEMHLWMSRAERNEF